MSKKNPHALIAQLDRAFGYGPKGWEFESLWVHQENGQNQSILTVFIRFLLDYAVLLDAYQVFLTLILINVQEFVHLILKIL